MLSILLGRYLAGLVARRRAPVVASLGLRFAGTRIDKQLHGRAYGSQDVDSRVSHVALTCRNNTHGLISGAAVATPNSCCCLFVIIGATCPANDAAEFVVPQCDSTTGAIGSCIRRWQNLRFSNSWGRAVPERTCRRQAQRSSGGARQIHHKPQRSSGGARQIHHKQHLRRKTPWQEHGKQRR